MQRSFFRRSNQNDVQKDAVSDESYIDLVAKYGWNKANSIAYLKDQLEASSDTDDPAKYAIEFIKEGVYSVDSILLARDKILVQRKSVTQSEFEEVIKEVVDLEKQEESRFTKSPTK